MIRINRAIIAVQLALIGIICLDAMGIYIPFLRPLLAFIYLMVIPGFLILRVLKINYISINILLYSIGLSISALMFLGFFMNSFYVLLSVEKPLALFPILVTTNIFVLALLALESNHNNRSGFTLDVKKYINLTNLSLGLLPFLTIFGVIQVNYYKNNSILMVILAILAIVVLIIGFDYHIDQRSYVFVLFILAFSLLVHNSLISEFLWGWDVFFEYYISNQVITNSFWDPTKLGMANFMLSIVMLAPVISLVSNIELIWIFKILYIFLYALVPLGIYLVLEKQTNEKIAIMSSIFFICFFTYFMEMPYLARQQIAEFYFVLILMIITDKRINTLQSSILLMIFIFSIIVSHYSVSYILLFNLFISYLFVRFVNYSSSNCYVNKLSKSLRLNNFKDLGSQGLSNVHRLNFLALCVTFALAWYIFISPSSSPFTSLVNLAVHVVEGISSELLNPESSQGMILIIHQPISPIHFLTKYIHLLSIFFIIIGTFYIMFHFHHFSLKLDYITFIFASFLICLSGVILPYFASALNTARLFHICLITLSLPCVLGGIITLKLLASSFNLKIVNDNALLKGFSLFLAIMLLMNSGWAYELLDDQPNSIALNISLTDPVDFPIFNEREVLGAKWLIHTPQESLVYADGHRTLLIAGFKGYNAVPILDKNMKLTERTLIYLGNYNICLENLTMIEKREKSIINHIKCEDILNYTHKIYDNSGSQIWIGRKP